MNNKYSYLGFASVCLVFLNLAALPHAWSHGTPIDLIVDPATNRLAINGHVEHGVFDVLGGAILTDEPGVGVSDPSNGIAANTEIGFVVTQGLLYWDGSGLASTAATLSVIPAVGPGYSVTSGSGLQTGMPWGTYDGSLLWDAHADFLLTPGTASPGVYGLGVQFVADSYGPSEPALLPLVLGTWTEPQIDAAIELMEQSLLPVANADFDNNGMVDADDLAAWSAGFGTAALAGHGQGEADGDGDVDGADFLVWQRSYTGPIDSTPVLLAPEPSTLAIVLIGGLTLLWKLKGCNL